MGGTWPQRKAGVDGSTATNVDGYSNQSRYRDAFAPSLRRGSVAGWPMRRTVPEANPWAMTTAPATSPVDTTARRNDPKSARTTGGVSLPRLYALRAAYLIIAVGLALVKWP